VGEEAEDQGGDGAEEFLIVAEKDPEGFRDGEDEPKGGPLHRLAVREFEQELLVKVFGEQEGAFHGAGGAEVEAFTGEGAKVFESAFWIRALDAGDALGVIAAGFESLYDAGDPFQTEPAVVLGVEGVVGKGELLEVVVEDVREDGRPPRNVFPWGFDGDRGGGSGHASENGRFVLGAWAAEILPDGGGGGSADGAGFVPPDARILSSRKPPSRRGCG
jgi:hypothetical protein